MITRRNFLKASVAASLFYRFGKTLASDNAERSLSLYNIHTDESLDIQRCRTVCGICAYRYRSGKILVAGEHSFIRTNCLIPVSEHLH